MRPAADSATRSPRWAPALTLPLGLLGVGVSAYLTVAHYAAPRALSCPETGVVNCAKVTSSAESMLPGGVPVALAGLLFFCGLTLLLTPAAWRARSRWVGVGRTTAVVAGLGMVCYLVFVEAVVLHALCLWCTVVHVDVFVLFVAVLAAATSPDAGSHGGTFASSEGAVTVRESN